MGDTFIFVLKSVVYLSLVLSVVLALLAARVSLIVTLFFFLLCPSRELRLNKDILLTCCSTEGGKQNEEILAYGNRRSVDLFRGTASATLVPLSRVARIECRWFFSMDFPMATGCRRRGGPCLREERTRGGRNNS